MDLNPHLHDRHRVVAENVHLGVEQAHLQAGVLFGARFVHLLDDLEGKDDIADLARLAVPDQFHLTLVLKQQKAVLVRQRPAASIKRTISCCSCSVSRGIKSLFLSVFYSVLGRGPLL